MFTGPISTTPSGAYQADPARAPGLGRAEHAGLDPHRLDDGRSRRSSGWDRAGPAALRRWRPDLRHACPADTALRCLPPARRRPAGLPSSDVFPPVASAYVRGRAAEELPTPPMWRTPCQLSSLPRQFPSSRPSIRLTSKPRSATPGVEPRACATQQRSGTTPG
jgi:hypothetical protein